MDTTRFPASLRSTATRADLRFGILGVVFLIVALVQLSGVFSSISRGEVTGGQVLHLGMAGVGVALVVVGLVRAARR